jgi:Lon protease-like protein
MYNLRNLFGRRSQAMSEFFLNAVRVYALRGEEDARCAAIAVAKAARKKQRQSMMASLSQMAANATRNGLAQDALKPLAHRLALLKQDLMSKDWEATDFEKEKDRLSQLNEEYLSCLKRLDSSVFPRKYPYLF